MPILSEKARQIEHDLKRYEDVAVYMENLRYEIEEKEELLQLAAAPATAHITAMPSSKGDTSQEERTAIQRERLEELLVGLRLELVDLRRRKRRIDTALAVLSDDDRQILKGRFWEPKIPWDYLARRVNCSASTLRRRLPMLLERMAAMTYGVDWDSIGDDTR